MPVGDHRPLSLVWGAGLGNRQIRCNTMKTSCSQKRWIYSIHVNKIEQKNSVCMCWPYSWVWAYTHTHVHTHTHTNTHTSIVEALQAMCGAGLSCSQQLISATSGPSQPQYLCPALYTTLHLFCRMWAVVVISLPEAVGQQPYLCCRCNSLWVLVNPVCVVDVFGC